MTLPRLDEYQLAVQNPKNAFKDTDLQSCKVETNPLGLPAVKTGGFALIYHLYRKEHWAVRCFYREIGNLQHRYDAISRFLEKHANGTFVKASLQPEGILVRGNYYPVLVMPWVVGDVLNLHIERNLSKPNEITWLADAFLKLVNHLEQLGVAHGDFQHGNIMVRNNALTLIDYDGMYLPELSKSPAKVLGHLNYIHPDRPNVSPSAQIDRFPSIVIYLALRAVAAQPSLWRKYSDGENMLFQRNDFLDPLSSSIINDLKQIPSLRTLANKFQAICFLNFDKIPSLSEFISADYSPPSPPQPVAKARPTQPVAKPIEYITQYEVILAEDTKSLLSRVGEKIEVVGQVTESKRGITRRNAPYMFFNFGDWRKKAFCLVLWADALDLMQTSGIRPSSLVHKCVSVTGMITEYNGRPQMVIEIPSQIQQLSSKEEAFRRLSAQKRAVSPQATPIVSAKSQTQLKSRPRRFVVIPSPVRPQPISYPQHVPQPQDVLRRQDADALRKLYGPAPSTPVATPTRLMPASPRLFWVGISLTILAVLLTFASSLTVILLLLVVGLVATYWGGVYRFYLVPVRILSGTFGASYPSICRKCRYIIRLGESIVKTDIGYLHTQCAQIAKRRIWKKETQIRLPRVRLTPRAITVSRPRTRLTNLASIAVLGVAVLSIAIMSYPSVPYLSTSIRISSSLQTFTSFTASTYQSSLTTRSTTCSWVEEGDRECETVSVFSFKAYTSTRNVNTYVQTFLTSSTNSITLAVPPYTSLGIYPHYWPVAVVIIVIIAAVGVALIRRI